MDIISRAEIGLVDPTAPPWRKPTIPAFVRVDGLIVHWVGNYISPTLTETSVRTLLRTLQQSALHEGYSDIEYNFAISAAGHIYELRGWGHQSGANGSANYNRHAIAIVYLAGPTKNRSQTTPLTAAAKVALLALCQAAAKKWPATSYVWPHSRVRQTECPGDEVRSYLPFVQAHLHDTAPAPSPLPIPPTNIPMGDVVKKKHAANVKLDDQGNGYVDFADVPFESYVTAYSLTTDPPTQGYGWKTPSCDLVVGLPFVRVVLRNGPPRAGIDLFVCYA